jgi:hypothetical protein
LQQVLQDNPKLKSALGSNLASLLSKGIKFFAVEPNYQAAVAPTVSVVVEPAPGIQDSDVTQSGDQVAAGLTKAGATVLGTRVVTFDGHQALQVSETDKLKDPLGNAIPVPATQYEVGANDFVYLISLSGTSPDFSTIATTFNTATAPSSPPTPSGGGSASSATTPVPSTVSSAPNSSSAPRGAQPSNSNVIPAPVGYALGTSTGTTNGPISPSDFNHTVGPNAAESSHFVSGYDVTYDSNITDESIEVTLLTFASPADASGFEPALIEYVGSADLSPKRSTLGSVPGSVLLTATKAGHDGFYLIDVVAIKGPTVMAVEYANDATPSGVPDVLLAAATQQYARL